MNQRTQNTKAIRNAFTIVEMLVVIGILVVVTVGVATIFASVGDTVAKGRKLSELNQFAARIERVMRQDFERMTRDGFLVIVNKNANLGEDVQLYRGEQTDQDGNESFGRIRRSDEIMFFARGDFETARRAIASNMRATSSEAAIYYGHGQKRAFDPFTSDDFFLNPQPWDNNYSTNDYRLGVSDSGRVNPNQFARDWSLLRHVTLLTNPGGAGSQVPDTLFGIESNNFGTPDDRLLFLDSGRQIALQPAARSIFKSLAGSDTSGLENRWLYDAVGDSSSDLPFFRISGMVDIVTQDLATIRNEIQALAFSRSPSFYMNQTATFNGPLPPVVTQTRDEFERDFYQSSTQPNPQDALSLNLGKAQASGNWSGFNTAHASRIRQWMIDALPSAWNLDGNNPAPRAGEFLGGVRYEDIPTRIIYTESDGLDAMERAYAEANQEMLGASVFVPRCTEFVVEWSYGFVDNQADLGDPGFKELIWYGLDRLVDSNNDGQLDPLEDQFAAWTYRQRNSLSAGNDPTTTAPSRSFGPPSELVVGRPNLIGTSSPGLVEAACFGFATQPGATEIEGAYWPWPKLIRITMSLGDPNDRDIEQTYQVVFEIPSPE